jgi:hypothetical protein
VKTTLETSGEDVKLHSKRVGKIEPRTCHGFMLYKTVDGVDHSNDTPFNIMQNQPDISTDPREEGVPSVMCFDTAGTQVRSLSFKNFSFC